MTYLEAIQFLYDLRLFGSKLGLANTFKLAALAGKPQNQLRFIHVAGTNGKGSTCAMLESMYRAAGLRVGLFTSPHLVAFGERIQVNRELITPQQVVRSVVAVQPLLKEFPPGEHPTFFEVLVVMALRHFVSEKCDLVIWETGLGGRLDATNIVTPLASVITNVQYDHQKWLGNTLASIAAEKAGIIKPQVPVITAAEGEPLKVIREVALRQRAPLRMVAQKDLRLRLLEDTLLPLRGGHQRWNAAVAIATVETLKEKIPVSAEAIRSGLSCVNWPGRLQLLEDRSGRKILLDGAHNIAGAETLKIAFQKEFAVARCTLILGLLGDKDVRGICQILAPVAAQIFLVPVSSERTAAPAGLQEFCRQANPNAETIVCDSLRSALEQSAAESFVLITGSLYLVGEALELLQARAAGDFNERALNEWTAKR